MHELDDEGVDGPKDESSVVVEDVKAGRRREDGEEGPGAVEGRAKVFSGKRAGGRSSMESSRRASSSVGMRE